MFAAGLLDLFFPPSCMGCGKVLPSAGAFCESCDLLVEVTASPNCQRCSEPGDFGNRLCPRCRTFTRHFERAFAPFTHAGPIARAIHRFKYEDHPELAPRLAQLLINSAPEFIERAPKVVCAIPLHVSRFRARRYDQALLLTGELAKATGRNFRPNLLERTKKTARQVGLSDSEREANVAGAFHAKEQLSGEPVLLLDDVFTTGATASAAADALIRAGASSVQVLTIARANLLGT
jgi:ComF family protein